jgi:hypothetical protein
MIQRWRKGRGGELSSYDGFQDRGTRRSIETLCASMMDWSWAVMIDGVDGW